VKINGKSFLVTGGAGFIGSHLVEMLLEKGAEKVVIFDNFIRGSSHNLTDALPNEKVELFGVKGDTTHMDELEDAVKGIDGVFHLAALCLAHCQDYPRASLDVNVVGTFNILEACIKNKIKRVIFASSSSIYGNSIYSPMDEKHPWGNRNFYGATKIAGEALIRAFHFKYGLDYLAYRFMNVYGPRQDYLGVYIAVIIKIIDRLHQNLPPIIYGDGSQAYDFVFVKDACRSLVYGMESSINDESYNISSGKQTSILEVCNTILKLMDKEDIPIEFKEVNDNTLVKNRIGSTEKAKIDLGFEVDTSLEEGLMQVIEWKLKQNCGS
jgi:UDP-glucose 4-epimerase